MDNTWITGLASIALEVADLERSTTFYTQAWGLAQVGEASGRRFFRCAQGAPVALSLRQGRRARFESITLQARDAAAVQSLHARLAGEPVVRILAAPGLLSDEPGKDYGMVFEGPQGLRIVVAVAAAAAPMTHATDPTRPLSLTHVVLNSADMPQLSAFFTRVLGLSLSDRTDRMDFLRCGADHHTVALAHGNALSLNHAAFEMRDIDSIMYGTGRLLDHGYVVEWGLGRHGPGNNVFSYFVDPDGFAVEYTTEMEQVGEDYEPHFADYWSAFPRRPCRWGVARKPSERMMRAMAGAAETCLQANRTPLQADIQP